MNATRRLGIVLLVFGVVIVIYGGFTDRKDTMAAKVGPATPAAQTQDTFDGALWVGLVVAVVGGVLLIRGGGTR